MDARERLIESAQDLLWERGYTGTSPRAIQHRADAGQGSMYHHFAGKHELAREAIARTADQLKAEAAASLATPGTATEKIGAYLTRQRDVLRGCRVGRLAADPDIITAADLREQLAATFAWLRETLARIVASGQRAGQVSPRLDPHDTAATIVAVVQGGYVLARSADSTEPFEQAVSGLLALIMKES
ncbi:MAG TPA: TetR/AcrR family transcriptional regulator [Streptosporangiaceae bacterium]|nr:TetR/AcrR family transcriptional regulator [Streptosporangiaceae bacterium]